MNKYVIRFIYKNFTYEETICATCFLAAKELLLAKYKNAIIINYKQIYS